ncbi:hypothetical protein EDC01DRAFT_314660 [Geopyxis carbonaria]|nr:hypothetical protein EDC01DRAFT_314660 [Geopyxis carbonaria]
MAAPQPTITFFGATGGCAIAALVRSLKAGYTCVALVRTPSKLETLLAERSAPTTTLTIHAGNVRDPAACALALRTPSGAPTTTVIFGIGGAPKFSPNPLRPFTLDDPSVCAEGMASVLAAMATTHPGAPPFVVVVSTTGLAEGGVRDVPLPLVPLYHWMLAVPHQDKKLMEERMMAGVGAGDGWVIVKPTLLTDGKARGEEGGLKAGYDGRAKGGRWGGGEGVGAGMGYTISREDVGNWIWEECIKVKEGAQGGEWRGKRVRLAN